MSVYSFKKIVLAKDVKIEQYDFYEKKSFRNRCLLAGPNGLLTLSVPVENGRNFRGVMKEVKICYKENWQLRHWRSIHDAYRKSPFFEWYMHDIKALFETRPVYLQDWNLQWLNWLLRISGIEKEITLTENYQQDYETEAEDMRSVVHPGNYLEFAKDLPVYMQVFSHKFPFAPNLSFLDMLLCDGPNAVERLKK